MKKTLSIVAAIAALSFSLFSTSAASAHDEVVSTDPTAGEQFEAGLIPVTINFNEEVLVTEGNEGIEIRVSDSKGVEQPTACLSAGGTSISVLTSLAATDDYTVDWRSVSSDGHATEGTFKFSVSGTNGYEQEAADAIACPMLLDAPVAVSDEAGVEEKTAAPTANDQNNLTGLAVGAGFIVLGAVATAVTAKVRERRANKPKKSKNDDDDDGTFLTTIA
ncbi:MAG: hypothetical protein RIR29_512 [Actinomycetota bacterium]